MLALSLLEFLFGLLINRSISDKTSNCFNVVSVSVLASAVCWMLHGGKAGTWMWFKPENWFSSVKHQKRSKHQSCLILLWDTTRKYFLNFCVSVNLYPLIMWFGLFQYSWNLQDVVHGAFKHWTSHLGKHYDACKHTTECCRWFSNLLQQKKKMWFSFWSCIIGLFIFLS